MIVNMNEKRTLDDVYVSTHTFIAYTNINDLNLDTMFDEIEINNFLTHMLYKTREKGFKKEKKPRNSVKIFLNCIFFYIDKGKKLNIKLFRNGVIQLAGCKNFSDCKLGLDLFWNTIKNINCCSEFENLEAYIVSVMRNANVYLGFSANREKLGKYVFKKAGKYKIDPVIDGFIGKKFLAEIDSIDDMPVYKIRIEKNGELIEEDSIEYGEFAKLMKTSKSSKKIYYHRCISNRKSFVFWYSRKISNSFNRMVFKFDS